MKRKIVNVLLCVVLGVSLLGCASQSPKASDSSKSLGLVSDDVTEESPAEVSKESPSPNVVIEESSSKQDAASPDVRDFLNGNIKAVLDEGVQLGYDDFEKENCGKEFTFDEVTEFLCNSPYSNPHTPTILTYVLSIEDKDILLIKYDGMDIYSPDDDSFVVLAVCAKDDGYHITYEVESWCRSEVYIYPDGVISSDGSAGAGDHIYDMGYLNSDGKYNLVSYAEECYSGWIRSLFQYYKDGMFSNDTLTLAAQLDGEESVITLYTIDGTVYGFIEEAKTQTEKDLIESSKKDGLEWISLDEMKMKVDKAMKAGVPNYDSESLSEISWEIVNK